MNDAQPVIDVAGLTKSFGGKRVVDDVSLRVGKGQIYGFLGPNGSGKTTTLRMLCGLLTPDAGSGTCLGFDIRRQAAAIKRRTGYMTQKFSLYEDLTIRENLDFVGRVYGLRDLRRRVDGALERLGLAGRQKQLAGQLSGGWKQRLALAACILHEPELLLLDEPTAGVDPKARRDFWDQIHALAGAGLTVLVSTHYMDEAERCHEILYIAYGRLIAKGTIRDVIATHDLATWSVEGPDLHLLSRELQTLPGVDTVAAFGAVLHVCGRDEALLEKSIAPYRARSDLHWERSSPSLEDIFIQLMAGLDSHSAAPDRRAPRGSAAP
ncbi:ABC transporter ATP-binding protein [Dongia sp.]|uniref:ABC transporter ATP-binding protein n=1 Tax=Dongia sp. TaxID=1977262 RepID=UPI0035B38F48